MPSILSPILSFRPFPTNFTKSHTPLFIRIMNQLLRTRRSILTEKKKKFNTIGNWHSLKMSFTDSSKFYLMIQEAQTFESETMDKFNCSTTETGILYFCKFSGTIVNIVYTMLEHVTIALPPLT